MSEEAKIVTEDGIGCLNGGLASVDGETTLFTTIWFPSASVGGIRGIVQIIHGMSEHMMRYQSLAIELCRHGYIVAGLDHVGHGRSAQDAERLGHLPIGKGADIMVTDCYNLSLMLRGAYPDAPFFLYGHSMGSFIARKFVAEHPEGLNGAIICGSGQPARALSLTGITLCRAIAARKGDTHRSSLINGMAVGNYANRIPDMRTDADWLSRDNDEVDAFISDPLCGAVFTVGGYDAVTSLTADIVTMGHAKKVPAELPLYFIAGTEDPVGDYGKGVKTAVEMYRKAGVRDVAMTLYPGMRHEVHNELGKEQVFVDVLNWIEDHR